MNVSLISPLMPLLKRNVRVEGAVLLLRAPVHALFTVINVWDI